MPYITREDGERFIIPSYRDVLSAKKAGLLKREILLLASNYGEYITLQKKGASQYEVAFSPEPGSLLGETVWQYFKRPRDLIYCEAVPNTTDVVLVIVKSGSVYLDGSFPADSVPEELIVFQTQQNNFEIYIYGDVPISDTPEEGKFSFDPASVKSFNVLDKPVFQTMPLVKSFQLQLVDVVLKSYGIGAFPVKRALLILVIIGLSWMAWNYATTHKKEIPQVFVGVVNPYQLYLNILTSPSPAKEINTVASNITKLFTIPGWTIKSIKYDDGELVASIKSFGARTNVLFDWAKYNAVEIIVDDTGFNILMKNSFENRVPPSNIFNLNELVGTVIDRLSYVLLEDNPIKVSKFVDRGKFNEATVTINFSNITPSTLALIGQQFKSLPLVLISVTITVNQGNLSGSIVLNAVGN